MFKFKTNAMAALVLGLGLLTACSSNDELGNGTDTAPNGSTYMSVAINLSTGSGTRADNQEDTGKDKNPDYNFLGKWAGKDKIKAIDVYVFNAESKLEIYQKFSASEFQVLSPADDHSVTVTPSKGIKVLPGAKKVYVVVNPTDGTDGTRSFLPKEEKTTTLAEFTEKYENVNGTPGNFFAPTNTGNAHPDVKTSADKIASVETDNSDVITMTAIKFGEVTVKDNVSEKATLEGDETNRAKLTVKRAVARVMVTTTADKFEVKGDDALTQNVVEKDAVLGTISNIRYVVAQGENSLYFMQKVGTDPNLTYLTPNSDYLPVVDEEHHTTTYTWEEAGKKYDYSGLWKGYNAGGISGVEVPTKALYDQVTKTTSLDKITGALADKLNGEFILPNTHKYGVDQDASGYRKGNTAYVLVRAKFVPKTVVKEDGGKYENSTYPEDQDFYLGANGVFYENITAAHDETHYGVAGQKATLYVKGKTLYYAWINPDKTNGWINSPVNRNNIYHIEISGFKRIGTNWNPLIPNDPLHPDDPTNNPNNPDPKPNNPDEPTPPVKPDDPLTPKETWMSVQTTILPWNVHSYSVELDM